MKRLFQNKYRVDTTRAQWWDYASNGAYFVTICTENREHFFGEIKNREMNLSAIGQIAYECWEAIPDHFPFVELDAFIIMPNHVHGIIIINKQGGEEAQDIDGEEAQYLVPQLVKGNKFGPQSKNLASIIRGFKVGVTKNGRLINKDFKWQSRYHDTIIRDDKAHLNIRNYIINNPKKWSEDEFRN